MIDWTNAVLLFAFLPNQLKHMVAVQANLLETLTLQKVYCLIDIIIATLHLFCYQRNIQSKYNLYYQIYNNSIFCTFCSLFCPIISSPPPPQRWTSYQSQREASAFLEPLSPFAFLAVFFFFWFFACTGQPSL
ncbi:hypothetical protein ACB098_11G025000 [Castanea mollissima]